MDQIDNNLVHENNSDEDDILVRVDNVSKKFCRSLKLSLWYGVKDITSEFFGGTKHDKLRKNEFWAVNGVSFELRRGECLGLIGHNGAGKSTLLKMLNGLIKPDQGKIEINGRVGALIELGTGFNPILTGRENVYNNAAVLGFSREEVDEKFNEIVEFSEVGEFIDTPVQNYSSGMKVRLGFGVAAQFNPDVLIIDEVLAVGDTGFKMKSFNKISNLLKNTAIIFVSHSMAHVSRLCTQVLMLERGVKILHTKDLQEAIYKYESSFTLNQTEKIGGGIKVSNLLINDSANRIINLNYLENIQFQFEVKIETKLFNQIDKVFYTLLIMDRGQKPIATVESSPEKMREFVKVSVNVESVQLSIGIYYLSLNIYGISYSGNRNILYREINLRELHFKGGTLTSPAPFSLSAVWKNY